MKKHWEEIYEESAPEEVSWYQTRPEISLKMIEAARLSISDPLIDVGGGASRLVDHLMDLGYTDLTVLDISGTALDRTKTRLGPAAKSVHWVETDITRFTPDRRYALWHDRAVFHFLTNPQDRTRYLDVLNRSVVPGGHVLIATFALDGPEKCSGLPVQRYSHELLQETLGNAYELVAKDRETHVTPWGKEQKFLFTLFRRK